MAGIYIHIPFCKKACHYCDFHFSTSLRNKEAMVDAICKEITIRKDYLSEKELTTLYFGGGTPSLLTGADINNILKTIRAFFVLSPAAEITLEANPDDLTPGKTDELKTAGINRLSIGIQSFNDAHLVLMNRTHTARQASDAVKHARNSGIENISIDLIYGLPGLTPADWQENLTQAFSLGISHLSAYCLTVEKKTALHHFVQKKEIILPEEPVILDQFRLLMEEAGRNGFIHYEVSNFCKEGAYSKHNSSYWKNEPYLGIGPSAHSYNGASRQWNISNNALYIKGIQANEAVYEKEVLSEADRFNEYIMTRLRTIWGIDLQYIESTFGEVILKDMLNGAQQYIHSGYMQQSMENVTLTPKGKFIADKIASDLFI